MNPVASAFPFAYCPHAATDGHTGTSGTGTGANDSVTLTHAGSARGGVNLAIVTRVNGSASTNPMSSSMTSISANVSPGGGIYSSMYYDAASKTAKSESINIIPPVGTDYAACYVNLPNMSTLAGGIVNKLNFASLSGASLALGARSSNAPLRSRFLMIGIVRTAGALSSSLSISGGKWSRIYGWEDITMGCYIYAANGEASTASCTISLPSADWASAGCVFDWDHWA